MFTKFAKWMSSRLGDSKTFLFACLFILTWLGFGPFYNFSETWQLIINTLASVVTLLMVFLIQNTQNRDTKAIHLKLDEIIYSIKNAKNELLKIEELSDQELDILQKRYEKLAKKEKNKND